MTDKATNRPRVDERRDVNEPASSPGDASRTLALEAWGPRAGTGRSELSLSEQKEHVLAAVQERYPSQVADFRAAMSRFEARVSNQQQIAGTYQQIDRLLRYSSGDADTQRTVNALGKQVLDHAANPSRIEQGAHDTCGAGAAETLIYSHYPASAARLVADAAIDRRYAPSSGKALALSRADVSPDEEASKPVRNEVERDHASQIFQNVAINLAIMDKGRRYHHENGQEYETREGKAGTRNFRGLYTSEISDAISKITGQNMSDHILIHDPSGRDNNPKFTTFSSSSDLMSRLDQLAERKSFPAIVYVNVESAPYNETDGFGGHYLTVRNYDTLRERVELDDQRGPRKDWLGQRAVSFDTFFQLTRFDR